MVAPASRTTVRPPILVSVLNWNGLDDTLACLRALSTAGDGIWDVLVIDNGSDVDPAAALNVAFPAVEALRLADNTGFAGGQNHGIRLAIDRGYEAVLLLNNDCEISAGAIAAMLAEMRADPLVAAVSPLIYCTEQRDKPQMVAAWLDWERHCSERPSSPGAIVPTGMPTMVPGTALLLRCSALEQLGLLDTRYFAYYEDNDISARIAARGLQARFCINAKAWHDSRKVHEYSAMALYLSARNAWLFWRRHTPADKRSGMFRHLLTQSLYELALLKKAGADAKCEAVVAGFWDAQGGRFGAPPRQWHSPRLLRWAMCACPYFAYDLLTQPGAAIRNRLRLRASQK
jgi:GT2 family glycosyltransferase